MVRHALLSSAKGTRLHETADRQPASARERTRRRSNPGKPIPPLPWLGVRRVVAFRFRTAALHRASGTRTSRGAARDSQDRSGQRSLRQALRLRQRQGHARDRLRW